MVLEPGRGARVVRPLALGPLLLLAAGVAAVLIVGAGGYGYHRDELYFLAAGDHLAWSYADQGPLTPFMAHVMDGLAPGSLTALRVPAALMSAGTVLTTAAIARELGGRGRAQLVAAWCAAVASVVLVTGHLLSTATFDLLAWAVVTWLVARAIRTGDGRLWPVTGLVAGLALLDKPLIAFLLAALGAGVLLVGPRRILRSPGLWIGVIVALALWSPWLVWQADHSWPQVDVSSSIAAGGSASSQPRWALLPFQLLLVSPLLAPVWIAGLLALLRRPALREWRLFAVAWLLLVVVFEATGGKPYYLAGMFPVLLAAGGIETDRWLERGSRRGRLRTLALAVGLSGVVSLVIALPVLPARDADPVVAVDPDAGETIGWPELARTVARVAHRARGAPVVFTDNYGEAGAVDRYGRALGLPAAYSGHNAFGDWGPPRDGAAPVVVVGLRPERDEHFAGCRVLAHVHDAAGIDNDEDGVPVALCTGPRGRWSRIWSDLRHLG